jgi:hypothetical protein
MKFPPKATSAARAKLAETITARAEVDAKLASLQSSISRLNQQTAAVAPAQAALAAHDEAEDFAALRWARGEGPRPEPDLSTRERLARELSAATASAASATRAQAVLVEQMTQEASKPADIAKWADAAVVEVLAETATPMIDDLETAAAELVVRIAGLRTAANTALDLAERRRPRVLTEVEHAMGTIGRGAGVAVQHVQQHEDGTPHEALVAVGKLTERLRPGVWDGIAKSIIGALAGQHEKIHAKVAEAAGLWRQFESELREDSGVHFAGVR